MTTEKMLGAQVKLLLSGVSNHGTQHLTEVESDLDQTAILLDEAIDRLGASFMAIHAAVCAQQEALDALVSGTALPAEQASKLKAIQSEIGQHVNAAITGLQFQDMTSQLIVRTVKRVSGLREVLDTLDSGGSAVMPSSDAEEIITILQNINELVKNQSINLDSVLWKAVSQTHMYSGDIELF